MIPGGIAITKGNVISMISLIMILSLVSMIGPSERARGSRHFEENKSPATRLKDETLIVKKCADFAINGKGDHHEWNKQGWTLLNKLDEGGEPYESKFKIMYSVNGIYLLFKGADNKITTQDYEDNGNIFDGDVFEVFFNPDPKDTVYFEYEINPMEKELVLMFRRLGGKSSGWIPWQGNGSGIQKIVDLGGGERKLNAKLRTWTAEIFFPYTALGLLPLVPPKSGMVWNANFCRLDYDSGKMIKYSWSPTIETSFHELEKFYSIRFE